MSTENKRTVITAVRRVAFAGIILLAAWFIMVALREFTPSNFISVPTTGGPANSGSADRITAGPDGNMWFIQPYEDQIGKISITTGKITEYNVLNINDTPADIVSGPDGNLWITNGNNIGKMSPATGAITEYPLPIANIYPSDIISGPDGNLWFIVGNDIGKISPKTGAITEYDIPRANADPIDITTDSAGNLWFIESSVNKIGTISPATGVISEYDAPTANVFPNDITAGPDGNLWFTETIANQIDKISPKMGSVTEYDIPTANAGLDGITAGSDGNLWFTESYANKIASISPKTGAVTEYNIPDANTGPADIAVGPDGNLWFTEVNANQIGKFSPESGRVTEYSIPRSIHTNTWDWSTSYTNISVSSMVGPYIGDTLRAIALIGLMSLIMAAILLLIGVLVSSVTKRASWLGKVRGILRLVLVSVGAAIPMFVISGFAAIFILKHESLQQHQISFFWSAFFCSLLPAWLLVQSGYRMLANRAENTISLKLAQQISIRLFIKLLKLIGLIIVTTMMASWFLTQQGLGSLLMNV